MTLRSYYVKINSILGSVVPLAMFLRQICRMFIMGPAPEPLFGPLIQFNFEVPLEIVTVTSFDKLTKGKSRNSS